MNSRVLIALLPLVVLLMYPVMTPLLAATPVQDNSPLLNSDINGNEVILQVSRDYQSLLIEESGNIIFDLDRIIGGSGGKAFNTNARFIIGSPEDPVFIVTNNSDQGIAIKVEGFDHPGSVALKTAGGLTLAPGETVYYYFEVNTQNAAPGQITAQLQIRESADEY